MVVQTPTTVVVKILRIASENIEQFEADRRADQPHPSALVSGGWTRKTNHHHQRSHDTRRHQLGQLIDGRCDRWSAVVFGDTNQGRVIFTVVASTHYWWENGENSPRKGVLYYESLLFILLQWFSGARA